MAVPKFKFERSEQSLALDATILLRNCSWASLMAGIPTVSKRGSPGMPVMSQMLVSPKLIQTEGTLNFEKAVSS